MPHEGSWLTPDLPAPLPHRPASNSDKQQQHSSGSRPPTSSSAPYHPSQPKPASRRAHTPSGSPRQAMQQPWTEPEALWLAATAAAPRQIAPRRRLAGGTPTPRRALMAFVTANIPTHMLQCCLC